MVFFSKRILTNKLLKRVLCEKQATVLQKLHQICIQQFKF
jgi:hypothetical protein